MMLRIIAALCLLISVAAHAVIETYEFSSPELEERYQHLSAELRCPTCQNQNIADSNSLISQDLRKLLYEQLEAGKSDEEILAYLVERYGEFVRYRPKYDGATAVLWLAPAALLLLGVIIVVLTLRNRSTPATEQATDTLNNDEQQRLDELLKRAEQDK